MNMDYQAEKRISMLKARTKRCVCKYCGKPLHLKRIVFSDINSIRVEIFCENCNKIEFGVEKEIFHCARTFVEEMEFNCYPELEKNESTKRMTVAKVCEIIAWTDQNRGLLGEEGFNIDMKLSDGAIGTVQFVSRDSIESAL